MPVDIHTHIIKNIGNQSVYNIPLQDADSFFLTGTTGLFSVGVHPWYINEQYSNETLKKLNTRLSNEQIIFVGECGLDNKIDTPLQIQAGIFEKQIQLSEEKQKPVIIHCVGHYNELLNLKKQWKPTQKWIIHGFRGKPQLAEQILKAGCDLSFGEHFNADSIKITPISNLYIETDESKLPVKEIYCRIAAIKGCSVKDLNAGELLLRDIIK